MLKIDANLDQSPMADDTAIEPGSDASPVESAAVPDGSVEYAFESWIGWLDAYPWAQTLLGLSAVTLIAWLAHFLVKRYVVRFVTIALNRLPSWWAGVVIEQKVLHRLIPLVPIIIFTRGVALTPHIPDAVHEIVQRIAQAGAVLLIALAIGALLNTVLAIYNRYPISHGRPIKGYLQIAKILIYCATGIFILAALLGESPWIFLTGLGAMTAVILLIFRDTLLSLVAGIQLVNNDLIRNGDWIEMPQFNADGDVIDISLNVVQVRNWDKTITSIPTHKFLEHSFKNWRGMVEAGGRRIKRPLHIDMTTIRFLTEEEIRRFSKYRLLHEYIAGKVSDLAEYNRIHRTDGDAEIKANSRHLTNIGTFRAYILQYLKNHQLVNQDMTTLVRQLDPCPQGLPLEIWTHIKDTRWAVYENAQSDIFDHLLSIAEEFGLRVFQQPTGNDFAKMTSPPLEPRHGTTMHATANTAEPGPQ